MLKNFSRHLLPQAAVTLGESTHPGTVDRLQRGEQIVIVFLDNVVDAGTQPFDIADQDCL